MTRSALALVLLAGLAAGCVAPRVQSSAVATAPARAASPGVVALSATRTPPDAEELGLVEVSAALYAAPLGDLAEEFRVRVAALGGDFGRVERFETRFELVAEQHEFDCGVDETTTESRSELRVEPDGSHSFVDVAVPVTRHVARTCTEQRTVEVGTRSWLGRAFRSGGSP